MNRNQLDFNGEHDVDINLRVGVGHAPKMPLPAELENHFILVLQRCRAYGASRGNCDKLFEKITRFYTPVDLNLR